MPRSKPAIAITAPPSAFSLAAASRHAPREFRQAGIESFGAEDRERADAETVLLAVEAVRGAGLKDYGLRFGDIGLFYALLDALVCPSAGG